MHILKREVVLPRRSMLVLLVLSIIAASSVGYVAGLYKGYDLGLSDGATYGQGFVPDENEPAACGITAPLDCVQSLATSVADLFRPMPVTRIVYTPSRGVICAEAERDYWACIDDEACPVEKLEAIADDVNFCQAPRRR